MNDDLKALQAGGVRLPKPQKGQKATLRPFFPSLPHLARFHDHSAVGVGPLGALLATFSWG